MHLRRVPNVKVSEHGIIYMPIDGCDTLNIIPAVADVLAILANRHGFPAGCCSRTGMIEVELHPGAVSVTLPIFSAVSGSRIKTSPVTCRTYSFPLSTRILNAPFARSCQ